VTVLVGKDGALGLRLLQKALTGRVDAVDLFFI
jgi:hypothetical protein